MASRGGSDDEEGDEAEKQHGIGSIKTAPPEGPYSEQLREAILEATSRIIEHEGVHAATPTRIFAATGIARSTIYRYWPSKVELLDEALRRRNISQAKPEDNVSDLERLIRETIISFQEESFVRTLATIVGHADVGDKEDNARWKKLAVDLARTQAEGLRSFVLKAKKDGQFSVDLSADDLMALALGPALYATLLSGQAPSPALVEQVVDIVRERVDTPNRKPQDTGEKGK